ncbi:MAG: methyltransferase domain-containing protein [Acidobacteriota bacterium]|nr:methyltransferase domain-containing protein [Acidobacteriota bacterium]MDQ5836878.1 methyltransferase domain-containing protein [Acidobacteriota bacterium]
MFERFRQRSDELEHLDLGDYTPEEYEGCMVELRRVNRWLGDARALSRSVLPEIERDVTPEIKRDLSPETEAGDAREFSLLDVGAGTGELLREVARWARERKIRARLVGLELNERSALGILEESRGFGEIMAVRGDALRLPFDDAAFDYAMCSLFTHHFRDDGAVSVLREMSRVARRRVYVIDLHRHPVAYYFYTTVARLFLHNRLIREDGALSILRGFVPRELLRLAESAGLARAKVERRFPYRLVLSASK